jgi:hypothetical protein
VAKLHVEANSGILLQSAIAGCLELTHEGDGELVIKRECINKKRTTLGQLARDGDIN